MTFREKVSSDYLALINTSPSVRRVFGLWFRNPGFRSVFFFRIQESLQSRNFFILTNLISNLNQSLTGAEFVPGCAIGDSFVVRHPTGIVIGRGVVIGKNCTIQHGVTIGEKYIDANADGKYPEIGDDVAIGTGAIVVGGIKVGSNSIIGALTFVNQSIPSYSTAIGIPAKIRKNFLE